LKILWTRPFERDFRDLPKNVQARAEKSIRLLIENSHHPSLRTKKMQGTSDIWEARVTGSYRMTFQRMGESLLLRRIGTHDVLKKET
jgi:mRNA interferase RelE/StbE